MNDLRGLISSLVGTGLHVKSDCLSFIFKYETSTLTPFVKLCDVLNLAVQNIFYVQSYVECAFPYNPGSTNSLAILIPNMLHQDEIAH